MDLKEKIKNLFGDQKVNFKKYSMTFLLIAVITLVMVFAGFNEDHIEEFYITMILTTVLVFVCETYLEFKWYRIPAYIVCLLLSLGAKELIFLESSGLKEGMLIVGLYLSSVLIAIYKIIKDAKVTLSEYLSRLLNNGIIVGIATGVLQLGVLFILFIFTSLLLKDTNIDIYAKAEILLHGFFIIPAGILCLLNVKNDVLKPVFILISYILLPIVIVAEIIIYIYLFKVLITAEVPSNTIFPIITGLFAFAGPTWIMIESFKDKNKYLDLNTKIIPYSFIPLICMQIYAVGIRVVQNGLTPERYLGIALVLFEIITVILSLVKKYKHIDKLIFVLVGFIIVIMCIPLINVVDASWRSQLNRLTSVYEKGVDFDSLSEDNKKQVVGAYNYLKHDEYGKKHIPDYIDTDKLNHTYISSTRYDTDGELVYDESRYIYYKNDEKEFDIEGYRKIRAISFYDSYYKNEVMIDNLDLDEFELYEDNSKNDIVKQNLRNIIEEAMNKDKFEDGRIVLDDNNILLVSSFSMSYSENTKTILRISISGYLISK